MTIAGIMERFHEIETAKPTFVIKLTDENALGIKTSIEKIKRTLEIAKKELAKVSCEPRRKIAKAEKELEILDDNFWKRLHEVAWKVYVKKTNCTEKCEIVKEAKNPKECYKECQFHDEFYCFVVRFNRKTNEIEIL